MFLEFSNKGKEDTFCAFFDVRHNSTPNEISIRQRKTTNTKIPLPPPLPSSMIPEVNSFFDSALSSNNVKMVQTTKESQDTPDFREINSVVKAFDHNELKSSKNRKTQETSSFDPVKDIIGFDKSRLKKVVQQTRNRINEHDKKVVTVMVT